jgi:hypothetical protein
VPAAIYGIPYSSPLHYVTYVKVYDSTADTVVEGYTAGYQGSYVDPTTSVVVYGTGYVYPPYVGEVWVGPPVTYGFGASVRYTPYTGWSYGFGFGWAWGAPTIAVGWGWGAYPWWGPYSWGYAWGPPIYPAPYPWGRVAYGYHGAVAMGPYGWAGTTGNIYGQWGPRATVTRTSGGYNAWTGNTWARQVGTSYNSRTGVSAAGQRGAARNLYTGNYAAGAQGVARGPGGTMVAGQRITGGNTQTGGQMSAGRGVVYDPRTGAGTNVAGVRGEQGSVVRIGDDVYAGHDGNVYRRSDAGWEQRSGNEWSAPSSSRHELERESSARSTGSARAQSYHASRQSMARMPMPRGGGGFGRR